MTEMSEQPEQEQDQGEIKQVRRAKSGFWFGIIIILIFYPQLDYKIAKPFWFRGINN